jgi:putative glutamine amidotransferase
MDRRSWPSARAALEGVFGAENDVSPRDCTFSGSPVARHGTGAKAALMSRPIIGVTGPDRGGTAAWWFTCLAVWRSGGIPRRLTPASWTADLHVDAVIVGGGADVRAEDRWPDGAPLDAWPPAARPGEGAWRRLAGLALAPAVYALRRAASRPPDDADTSRDELERALLDRAATLDLPVLGICRGLRLLNAFAGGPTCRDLAGDYDEDPQPWAVLPERPVDVEPGSRLATALRTTACRVNGIDRATVNALGHGLRVAARERTGEPRALEDERRRFWIGVQWHPEYAPQLTEQGRLFDALVAAAAERRAVGRANRLH